MNINSVKESKRAEFHFTVTFIRFKDIVGEDAVINAFRGGSAIIDLVPFVRISGYGRQEPQVGSQAQINNLSIQSFVALLRVRTGFHFTGNHGAAVLNAGFAAFESPIKHFVAIGAHGYVVFGQLQTINLKFVVGAVIKVNKGRDIPIFQQTVCRVIIVSRVGNKTINVQYIAVKVSCVGKRGN